MVDEYDDIISAAIPKKPRRTYDLNQPDEADWSLDRVNELQDFYSTTFKRPLPLSNKGQSSYHNKLGFDHRDSSDISLNPTSAEGQQLMKFMRERNMPFLAFDRAIPGISSGPHIHAGRPSSRTGNKYAPGAQVKSKRMAGDNYDDIIQAAVPQTPATLQEADSYDDVIAAATTSVPVSTGRFGAPRAPIKQQRVKRDPFAGVRVGAQGEIEQPLGVGELRRLDDPEIARRKRIEAEVKNYVPRVLETKNPDDIVLERIAAERAQEEETARLDEWHRKNQPGIEEQTTLYRQDIQKAKALGGDANKWLAEMGTKGGAGLTEMVSGIVKPVTPELANKLRIHVEAANRAAQEEGADRNAASRFIQDVTAGFISTAPELAAMSAGIPAIPAFAAGSGVRAYGGDRNIPEAVGHGGLTGAAFELPVAGVLKKAGTVGTATTGIELASGADPQEALKTGLTNAAIVGVPGILRGGRRARQTEAEPNVRGTEVPERTDLGAVPEAQRFQHIQFGEVEVLADQSGAREGRIKVAEVADPTRQHFVKKSDMQGRGNARMIPIKESASQPVEVLPEKPQQPSETEGALPATPPSPPETLRVEPTAAKVPEWVRENVDQLAEDAGRRGVADKIEELSRQRLTAKEVAQQLGIDKVMVQAVRSKRGIPSMDDKADFERWVSTPKPETTSVEQGVELGAPPESVGEQPTSSRLGSRADYDRLVPEGLARDAYEAEARKVMNEQIEKFALSKHSKPPIKEVINEATAQVTRPESTIVGEGAGLGGTPKGEPPAPSKPELPKVKEAFRLPFIDPAERGNQARLKQSINLEYATESGRQIKKAVTIGKRQKQLENKHSVIEKLLDCLHA